MADDPVFARLRALVHELTGTPEAALTLQSTAQNTAGWDSVANLNLMASIEDDFGVEVTTADAMRLKSLGDLVAYLTPRTPPT
jgi:acyl carrier protein